MIHPHHTEQSRRRVRAPVPIDRHLHRQRGASLVESLVLLAVVALALVAAAIGLGRAYQDLVQREAVAIEQSDWDGWGAPEPPPPPPPPAPPPPPQRDTPFWQSALSFAIDLTPIGDIQTLMDPNASGADKALAIVGLGTMFLPGVGPAVKVASAGAKAAKAAKAAHKAENAVDDARDAAKAADEAEDGAAAAAKRKKDEPRKPPPKRMKQHDDCFKRNPAHDVSEFEDQLVSQAEGLNELTVEQYLKNRDLFKSKGRQPDTTQQRERDRVQRELEDDLYEHLLADVDNPTPEQQRDARARASQRIRATMRSLAALHNADQVGGGGLGAEGVGDRRVNSSLGSQWTGPSQTTPGLSRTEALEAAARAVPEGERGSTLLNVDFGEC